MGDEVCIWRNAEVLTKRYHFPCSIINIPIPSADGITAYQQLMWEVLSFTRPDGQSNDRHPSLRHVRYFSAY